MKSVRPDHQHEVPATHQSECTGGHAKPIVEHSIIADGMGPQSLQRLGGGGPTEENTHDGNAPGAGGEAESPSQEAEVHGESTTDAPRHGAASVRQGRPRVGDDIATATARLPDGSRYRRVGRFHGRSGNTAKAIFTERKLIRIYSAEGRSCCSSSPIVIPPIDRDDFREWVTRGCATPPEVFHAARGGPARRPNEHCQGTTAVQEGFTGLRVTRACPFGTRFPDYICLLLR